MANERQKRAVVVGASAGVGRALAERLAREGFDLVISARDTRDLDALRADLALRFGRRVEAIPLDLDAEDLDAEHYHESCVSALSDVDLVAVTAGMVHRDDDGSLPARKARRLVRVNFTAVVELLEPFVATFERRDRGQIVLFSSIAAAAPRGRNVVYGAAKAALEYYGRALRHRLAASAVSLQIVGLGYVDTGLSFGLDLKLPVAAPEDVADRVVRCLGRDLGLTYYPGFWRLVTLGLRHLPWSVYRRLDF